MTLDDDYIGEAHYLDDRELATVLCALRLLQEVHGECGGDLPEQLQFIRDNAGTVEPLDLDEIDELCDRLNS
jgi:hypothetical protein